MLLKDVNYTKKKTNKVQLPHVQANILILIKGVISS